MGCDENTVIRNDLIHHSVDGLYGYRNGKWKLIFGNESGGMSPSPKIYREINIYDSPGQLYNMMLDPSEQNNLYTYKANIVCDLDIRYRHKRYEVSQERFALIKD